MLPLWVSKAMEPCGTFFNPTKLSPLFTLIMPEVFGPIILMPFSLAVLIISSSKRFPSFPNSPNPPAITTAPAVPFSPNCLKMSFNVWAGVVIRARSMFSGISEIDW